jgi:hypothetical protein
MPDNSGVNSSFPAGTSSYMPTLSQCKEYYDCS